ncbi:MULTISPECIES: helix-turn-helix domain-containing protein [unclassified Pseudomonas]|uniref:helix-turn-helix domain-containing protein n=1 Tax=unclassified Pseudomonas TaxID=196821 RepID=UPI00177AE396|nr:MULTISPECIES: AraC family transcriptional regulator [unclassified Pseudomonas]MBD8595932.1 AraC family transcriptional regulator [Pseudomonas sp. CFBP 8758]MBD8733529.1 AraC family transcriptional regulator [Pseudomonas sp. CFBP 13710]
MRPSFEQVPTEANASLTMLNRRLPDAIPFEWHHHPEYELTLTLNSRGHRYISNDVAPYEDGDLVLVGPNVPHSWSSVERYDPAKPYIALVIWFSDSWAESLVALFPEMGAIRTLLSAAQTAVHFTEAASRELRPIIESMVDQDASQRLVSLLVVLSKLSQDTDARKISVAAISDSSSQIIEDARIRRVLDHIHARYTTSLSLPTLADVACVSVSAFHRMFKKHTRCTALDYIVRLRTGHACSLLMQSNLPVSTIAEQVGYSSQALFNRQFKVQKGVTPSEFRRQHGRHFK